MPELPEMEAWRRALDGPVSAFPIAKAGPAHVATLKTFDPPLAALEADGLVRRERDAEDGRIHRLRATTKGRRVMQRGRQRRIEHLGALLARLSPDEVAHVREAAELVERALAQ